MHDEGGRNTCDAPPNFDTRLFLAGIDAVLILYASMLVWNVTIDCCTMRATLGCFMRRSGLGRIAQSVARPVRAAWLPGA